MKKSPFNTFIRKFNEQIESNDVSPIQREEALDSARIYLVKALAELKTAYGSSDNDQKILSVHNTTDKLIQTVASML